MTTIVLNNEQAELLCAQSSLEIQDRGSNVIGRFIVDESDDLRIIKQRLTHPEPTYTWAEIKEYWSIRVFRGLTTVQIRHR